jgi:hypothetical protein
MSLKSWRQKWKQEWEALNAARPGERFEQAYQRQRKADRTPSAAVRWLRPSFAVLAFAVGVVLAFIPGPAVVFFALSAALFASQSAVIARALDRAEIWLRSVWSKLVAERKRRNAARG